MSKVELGQSLFEVVLATGLGALIMVAIVSLAAASISAGTFSKNSTQASRFAQEGIEWLRSQRDADATGFNSIVTTHLGPSYCLGTLPASISSWSSSGSCISSQYINGIFDREVAFCPEGVANCFGSTSPAGVGTYTKVSVSWTDAKGIHTVDALTSFTDWRTQ